MSPPTILLARDAGLDLDLLYDWIAADSGDARAEAVLRRIYRTIENIAAMPAMGRIRQDLKGAPHSFAVYPWLILYEPLGDGRGIVALRIVDGRRDVPRHTQLSKTARRPADSPG